MSNYYYAYDDATNNVLAHSKSYKYIRKYKGKNGKWVYVYKSSHNGNEREKKVTEGNKLFGSTHTKVTHLVGDHSYTYETVEKSKASVAVDNAKKAINKKITRGKEYVDYFFNHDKWQKNRTKQIRKAVAEGWNSDKKKSKKK